MASGDGTGPENESGRENVPSPEDGSATRAGDVEHTAPATGDRDDDAVDPRAGSTDWLLQQLSNGRLRSHFEARREAAPAPVPDSGGAPAGSAPADSSASDATSPTDELRGRSLPVRRAPSRNVDTRDIPPLPRRGQAPQPVRPRTSLSTPSAAATGPIARASGATGPVSSATGPVARGSGSAPTGPIARDTESDADRPAAGTPQPARSQAVFRGSLQPETVQQDAPADGARADRPASPRADRDGRAAADRATPAASTSGSFRVAPEPPAQESAEGRERPAPAARAARTGILAAIATALKSIDPRGAGGATADRSGEQGPSADAPGAQSTGATTASGRGPGARATGRSVTAAAASSGPARAADPHAADPEAVYHWPDPRASWEAPPVWEDVPPATEPADDDGGDEELWRDPATGLAWDLRPTDADDPRLQDGYDDEADDRDRGIGSHPFRPSPEVGAESRRPAAQERPLPVVEQPTTTARQPARSDRAVAHRPAPAASSAAVPAASAPPASAPPASAPAASRPAPAALAAARSNDTGPARPFSTTSASAHVNHSAVPPKRTLPVSASGVPGFRRAPSRRVLVGAGVAAAVVIAALFGVGLAVGGSDRSDDGVAPVAAATPTPTPTAEAAVPAAPTPIALPAGPVAAGVWQWDELGGGECMEPFTTAWAETFTVVDCATDHSGQLVATGLIPDAAVFPGQQAVSVTAASLCQADGVVDVDLAEDYGDIQVQTSYPVTPEQWAAGERRYSCFVSRSSDRVLDASLVGGAAAAG